MNSNSEIEAIQHHEKTRGYRREARLESERNTMNDSRSAKPYDQEFVNKLIEDFITSDYAPSEMLDSTSGFMPTNASKLIVTRLKTALEQNMSLALVHGPAGVGKTMSVKVFTERYAGDRRALYVRAHPEFAPSALLEELAIGLRMTRVSRFRTLIGLIREALERSPSVIVIDEAQLCPRATLETVKYLADETGALFVLVTTDEFVSDVRRWRDIESRIGIVAGISAMDESEQAQVFAESGFSRSALRAIHETTGGVMRDIKRLVQQVDKFLALNASKGMTRELIEPRHVVSIATKVNLSAKRRR
ncbi:MAG: ATP-binding protein [Pleurocapsa sp. SU_196_0]|nr:ATP-binding protein [Pleurocapsa sp. SU_196_0]